MRIFISMVLLAFGCGLCFLDTLAHAFVNSGSIKRYNEQLQKLPLKETYSRTELADAVWQIWTNKISLPEQENYTVRELKSTMSKNILGADQDSYDFSDVKHFIGKASGYKGPSDNGVTIAGVIIMLVGAFVLGSALPRSRK